MLPDPVLAFTIPSLHDGTRLEGRVYHPASLASAVPWKRHAAVIAHPYAPMGGCYDDPVVEALAWQLLAKGLLVGTFNFRWAAAGRRWPSPWPRCPGSLTHDRGAGRSAGRTSWTAKPERDDYASFVGFMVYFVHGLDRLGSDDGKPEPRTPEAPRRERHPPVLLMGGYSYGAMVATQLGPLEALLEPFEAPAADTDAARIRLRAEHLAEQHNSVTLRPMTQLHQRQSQRCINSVPGPGVAEASSQAATTGEVVRLPALTDLVAPRPAYMLISPLQGLITHLATMSLVPSLFTSRLRCHDDDGQGPQPSRDAAEAKLVRNPTLAIYGDKDVFVPAGKLRVWAQRLSAAQSSLFRGHEVASAGHFWAEEGALAEVRQAAGRFAGQLLDDE